jgi:phosphoglycerate dehydrogenase-like enzyme
VTRVLASTTAVERFGHLVDPEVEWIRHRPDGALVGPDGSPLADPDEVAVAWATADLLYDGSAPSFFGHVARASRLSWLQSSFAGLDHPAYPDLLARGCRVTISHENAISIAEYVVGSVLRRFQAPWDWERAQRVAHWRHHEFPEVWGSTWLIIGMGAIGSATAHRARAFGATVIGVRRQPTGDEPADEMITPDRLLEHVRRADVIVLALPGNRSTDGIVDRALLTRIKPTATLVNVARGSLIVDDALLEALDHLPDLRAILDVFQTEPLPADHPYWHHPQVTVTPHASSGGLGRHERNARLFARNLAAMRSGEPLAHEITASDLPGGARSSTPAQFQLDDDGSDASPAHDGPARTGLPADVPAEAPRSPAVPDDSKEPEPVEPPHRTLLSTRTGTTWRNRHLRVVTAILAFATAIGATGTGVLRALQSEPFELEQYYALGCLSVLLAWWTIYFNYHRLGLTNLRAFLRDKNPYRGDGKPVEHVNMQKDEDTNVVTKAAFSVGAQGILIAIIALFLDLVLSTGDLDAYQRFLRPVIVFVALLTILTMVLAIDILDTAANVYASGKWSPFQYRRWFNSGVGPSFPKGGASYAYYGFALFSAYIVLGLMFFYPLMSGYGVAIYTYLGYPFLFGYERVVNDEGELAVEVDESAPVGSTMIGAILLVATIVVGVATR